MKLYTIKIKFKCPEIRYADGAVLKQQAYTYCLQAMSAEAALHDFIDIVKTNNWADKVDIQTLILKESN